MFTIKVIEQRSGKPVKNAKVGIIFHGFFRGGTKDLWTDSDGEAHFDYDNGRGVVYVNGKNCYDGQIEGRRIIYI